MARVGLESWSSSVLTSTATNSLHFSRIYEENAENKSILGTPKNESLRAKLYVIAFIIIVFIGAVLFSCVAPFYPTRAIQKGVSLTVVGMVMGSMAIAGFVGSWILAMTMFRIGIKFLLCSGMFVAGCCAILFGVIDFCPPGASFTVYSFLIRMTEGVGVSMYFNSSYTMAAILFADNYAFIMGLLETATSVGTLLGPSIGGALYAV